MWRPRRVATFRSESSPRHACLEGKLIGVQLGSLQTSATESNRVRVLDSFLNEVQRLNLKPIFLVNLPKPAPNAPAPTSQTISLFNEATLRLAQAQNAKLGD